MENSAALNPSVSRDPSDGGSVVIFSINPNSGATDRRDLCETIAENLRRRGFDTRLLSDLEQVEAQTIESLKQKTLRAVVSAGGDGTIAMLANRLPAETTFAILPMGTENLLGRHLGLKSDPDFFTELITHGRQSRIDAGMANGKLFLVVASCGFDAAVVEQLDEVRSGHISRLSWIRPILTTIRRYQYPPLKCTIDGVESSMPFHWAFVFNIPKYAIGLQFTPAAKPTDGLLDVCTYRGGGILRGFWYMFNTFAGRHQRLDATQLSQFKKLMITSDSSVPYELDGDPGGYLPLEIEVKPDAIRLLLP